MKSTLLVFLAFGTFLRVSNAEPEPLMFHTSTSLPDLGMNKGQFIAAMKQNFGLPPQAFNGILELTPDGVILEIADQHIETFMNNFYQGHASFDYKGNTIMLSVEPIEGIKVVTEQPEVEVATEQPEVATEDPERPDVQTVSAFSSVDLTSLGVTGERFIDIMVQQYQFPPDAFNSVFITPDGVIMEVVPGYATDVTDMFSEAVNLRVNGEQVSLSTDIAVIAPEKEVVTMALEYYIEPELTKLEQKEASDFITKQLLQLYGDKKMSVDITEGTVQLQGTKSVIDQVMTDMSSGSLTLYPCATCLFPLIFTPGSGGPDGPNINVVAPNRFATCFSGETLVKTTLGFVKMEHLNYDHKVAVIKNTATIHYQRVWWFIHKVRDERAWFTQVNTTHGNSLELSGKHLIPVVPCGDSSILADPGKLVEHHSVFASEISTGDCLLAVVDGKLGLDKVESVEQVERVGYYSPVTDIGNLVTHNVVASCYSQVRSHSLQRMVFGFLHRAWKMLSGSYDVSNNDGTVPALLRMLHYVGFLLIHS